MIDENIEKDDLLTSIVENNINAIIVVNKNGEIVLANKVACELFKYTKKEFLNLEIDSLIPKTLSKNLHQKYREEYNKDAKPRHLKDAKNLKALLKDGTMIDVEIGLNPISIKNKPFIICTVNNISDNLLLQSKILESEQRFQTIVENNVNAIILSNKKGEIVLVNKTATRLFGYTKEEFVKLTIEDLTPKTIENTKHKTYRHEYYKHAAPRYLKNGQNLKALLKNGSTIDVEIGLNPISINNESFIVSTINDITKRLSLEKKINDLKEEQLETTKNQLVQADKLASLGKLIANTNHEINTPLGVIKTSVEEILEDPIVFEKLANLFTLLTKEEQSLVDDLIQKSISKKTINSSKEDRQLKYIIIEKFKNCDDILDMLIYINIDADKLDNYIHLITHKHREFIFKTVTQIIKQTKQLEICDLAIKKTSRIIYALRSFVQNAQTNEFVINDIIKSIENTLILYSNYFKHGVKLEKQFHKSLEIYCIVEQLYQVWSNLIINAIHAMDYEGTLTIKTEETNDTVLITVTDTGSGIPIEIQDKIYDPFFTNKVSDLGTGLGLHVSKQIIERHRGKIYFQTSSEGTCFTIELPKKQK